jgi:hypothetical protein
MEKEKRLHVLLMVDLRRSVQILSAIVQIQLLDIFFILPTWIGDGLILLMA